MDEDEGLPQVRPLSTIPDELWKEYWRRTPALRRAWRDERPSLRMHDPRATSRRCFIRGWAAAARAYRASIRRSSGIIKERTDHAVEAALAAFERTTNLSLLD